jgi:hypothetical protein
MATTPIERLLFLQGNRCFFCQQPLARADASVEHLLATANGGNNHDGNCVACCKAVNRLLGSLQLKDKFKVVLNQRGTFVCPDAKKPGVAAPAEARPPRPQARSHYDRVLEYLRKTSNARPRTLARLKSSVLALLPKGTSPADADALLARLRTDGIVTINGAKVAYQLK